MDCNCCQKSFFFPAGSRLACLIGNVPLLVCIKGGDLPHIGTGGFHVDGITKEQIRKVLSAADALAGDLAAALMALL